MWTSILTFWGQELAAVGLLLVGLIGVVVVLKSKKKNKTKSKILDADESNKTNELVKGSKSDLQSDGVSLDKNTLEVITEAKEPDVLSIKNELVDDLDVKDFLPDELKDFYKEEAAAKKSVSWPSDKKNADLDDAKEQKVEPNIQKVGNETKTINPAEKLAAEASEKPIESILNVKVKSSSFFSKIKNLIKTKSISEDEIEQIEEVLYTSDLGPKTVQLLMASIEEVKPKNIDELQSHLKLEISKIVNSAKSPFYEHSNDFFNEFRINANGLTVWLVTGVNGAGKTTTIGKIANKLSLDGKKVLLAASDTFRAAATEQLSIWQTRAGVEIFSPPQVKDPSAVAFDAVSRAKAKGFDFVIIDTAGRLHTQKNLMEELKKIKRVIQKVVPEAPHESLIVLDANSGQNAIMQAEQFHQALELSGVILSKMDGTAKGGVVLSLAGELGLPVKLVGVGEKADDLRQFDKKEFVSSLV